MLASFLITFREGLEAFLLVGIALSYLTKLNAKHFHKYIYMGVAAGFILSLLVAVVFQLFIDQFSNDLYRNYLMAGILLFATFVLTYMAIWMQKQAKEQTAQVKANLQKCVTTGNVIGLVMLSLLAVLREGFETILFFSALMFSGGNEFSQEQGIIGAVIGLALSLSLVWILMKGARKVPLAAFFRWTSLLIIIIAAGLLSSAVNMLQASELLSVFYAHIFDVSHILDDRGVFGTFLRALFGYNASPSLFQFATWGVYLTVFTLFWKKSYASS